MVNRFIDVINNSGNEPPVRIYIHREGWENSERAKEVITGRVSQILGKYYDKLKKHGHIIGTAWWDEIVDDDVEILYGFTNIIKSWPGRPRKTRHVFRNGIYVSEDQCELIGNIKIVNDVDLLLRIEREHRRESINLADYMRIPLSIQRLNRE